MKTIPLKTLTDKTPGYPESEFDYGQVLLTILTGVLPQGMNLEGMRKRLRVADAIEAAGKSGAGEVELEDADYTMLMQSVRAFRWSRAFAAAIELEDDLKAAAENRPDKGN